MAESEVTSENMLGGALYTKFAGPQVELSVEQDISSPDKSAADSSDCAMNSDAPIEELPNNNISDSGPLDCLDQRSDCPTHPTEKFLACSYKFDKKLIVKLEAPVFADKLNVSLNKVDSKEDAVTLKASDGSSDVSNGVVKKKRRSRQEGGRSRQRSSSGRGRPSKKKQTTIATYHSQISGDKNTIKIRIKKSPFTGTQVVIPKIHKFKET